jgi:hypothetical protein
VGLGEGARGGEGLGSMRTGRYSVPVMERTSPRWLLVFSLSVSQNSLTSSIALFSFVCIRSDYTDSPVNSPSRNPDASFDSPSRSSTRSTSPSPDIEIASLREQLARTQRDLQRLQDEKEEHAWEDEFGRSAAGTSSVRGSSSRRGRGGTARG